MPKLIAIDPGHGPETPGKRTPLMPDGKQIQEYQFNVPTARFLAAALQRCGFTTLLTATGVTDVPLAQRVGAANEAQADAFVSIHYNALRGQWDETEGGVETHYYPGSTIGQQLANIVQKQVAQGTAQVNRGVKASNFYVLRETLMPAILVENGFMDVHREADLMLNSEFQKEQAEQIAQGICQFFGTAYVAADAAAPSDQVSMGSNPIIGAPSASVSQAKVWAAKRGAAQAFVDIAPLYWVFASERGGVDPAVAYAQSAKETGFGRFEGVIDETFHNTAGIKIRAGGGNNDPAAHQRFASWQEGVKAHLDHLALYAGAPGYPRQDTPDPRHFPFIKGKAITVEALGGAWAPSAEYGKSIVNNYLNDLRSTAEAGDTTEADDPTEAGESAEQITELRRQLSEVQAKAEAAEQAADVLRKQLAQYRDYFRMQRELQELK